MVSTLRTYNASDALEDKGVCFAVHALNALPPKGGTGADGWCVLNADGTQFNGFNTNGSRTGLGEYTFTFNTPMPDVYYSVSATANSNASRNCTTTNKSTNGFTLKAFDSDNAQKDAPVTVAVHASNATLPQTVTQEQIDNALSNSCAAWGDVASDGTSSGLNVNQPNKPALVSMNIRLSTRCPVLIMRSPLRNRAMATELPWLHQNCHRFHH